MITLINCFEVPAEREEDFFRGISESQCIHAREERIRLAQDAPVACARCAIPLCECRAVGVAGGMRGGARCRVPRADRTAGSRGDPLDPVTL